MDIHELIPWISPIVTSIVVYLKGEGIRKASGKAAEAIGEKAGEALAASGPKALTTMRSWFVKKNDIEAQKALELVEQHPQDEDYQHKLIKETARVAADDPAFLQEIKVLAEQAIVAQSGGTVVNFNNQSSNQGVQAGHIDNLHFNPKD